MNDADAFMLARDLIAGIAAESKARHDHALRRQREIAAALRSLPPKPQVPLVGDDDAPGDA